MNFLLPPSRDHVKANLQLLAADWRAGGAQKRYFIVSLLLAALFSVACSTLSFVSLALGAGATSLGLACVAGACLLHAVGTWGLLKRRYQVRFAVF